MPAQILRPYQQSGLSRIMEAWKEGARSVLAILPTGGGKTSCFASLASQLVAKGKRSVLLVHRRELATQAAARFAEFGTEFGFIMSGEPTKSYARMQIASVQTLVRRRPPPADLVICDEAHLSTAKTWQTIMEAYPRTRVLGVTATPWRLSGKPLAGTYDASVVIATPRELREQGYLSPYVGFSYKAPDLSTIKTTGGDYNEQQSAAVMRDPQIVDNIVEKWQAHASNLSTIVFAVTVEHSKELCAKFRKAGISAEHLDGTTSLEQRRAILRRVESGQTLVLCNVGVAVEGLDIPRVKCIVLARPTKSLARYLQMVGRGRRPWQGLTCRIHDHAFTIKRHGLPDDDRDYSLNAAPEDPPSLAQCPECLAMYAGMSCPNCGREATEPAERQELATVADAEQFEFSSGDEAAPEQRPEKPIDVRWNNPGRVIEGVFAKQWTEKTSWGDQKRYLLRGEWRDYSLPGTTRLNALMAQVKTGDRLTVTFTGETPLGSGKSRKEFRLEVDEPDPAGVTQRFYKGEAPEWVDSVSRELRLPKNVERRSVAAGVRRREVKASGGMEPDLTLKDRAVEMVSNGETRTAVANKLGLSITTVAAYAIECNLNTKKCPRCNRSFDAKIATAIYCGAKCRKTALATMRQAKAKACHIKVRCAECKSPYTTGIKRSKYCSRDCRRAVLNRNKSAQWFAWKEKRMKLGWRRVNAVSKSKIKRAANLQRKGYSLRAIGRVMGTSHAMVRYWLNLHNTRLTSAPIP